MPPTPNFWDCWFRPIFDIFRSKTGFSGSGTIANASASKFGAISRSPCPKLNFLKPFQTKFNVFRPFLQGWFLGPSAFSEFTHFFKRGVYTGSHAHQRMRLEKLVWKNTVSARDLEYEIQIIPKTIFKVGPKAIFELVRPKVVSSALWDAMHWIQTCSSLTLPSRFGANRPKHNLDWT